MEVSPNSVSIEINNSDIDKLTKELSGILDGKEINAVNILPAVTIMMTVTAKYKHLNGVQKKELILYVLRSFITNNTDLDKNTIAEINFVIDKTVPIAIDLLVSASKSKFVFKLKKRLCSCLSL